MQASRALFLCAPLLSAVSLAHAADSEKVLPTVRVEAEADRPNEISLGKDTQSLRELPQSISVITREMLDQQNISSLPDIMKYTTGVTVLRFDGAGFYNQFYARGYAADTFLINGLNVRTNSNMADLDLAMFERIEVLRGPAGLFQGAGQPGVTINLQRKRALAPVEVSTMFGAGSWANYRVELDATGALTSSERLRGRLVTAYQDRDSHLDDVGAEKKLFYGTLEYDVTDTATLSVGGSYQDIQATTDQGLPAFANGQLVDVPRSTAIIADWNLQDMITSEAFAELTNRFSNGSTLKLSVLKQDRDSFYKSARGNGLTSPLGTLRIQYVDNLSDQTDTTTDLYYSVPFEAGGRSHSFLIGADFRQGRTFATHGDGPQTMSNVYDHNVHIPEPVMIESITQRTLTRSEEYGAYGVLRVRPVERLALSLGGRVSWWESRERNLFSGLITSTGKAESEITPYAGAVFDLTRSLSLYASYTDIFKPQLERTFAGEQLKPRTGNQYEAGIKGEFREGQLNASLGLFRINDENRALADPENPGYSLAVGEVRTQGVETEVSGRITPNWHMTAGYAYNSTKYIKAAVNQQGQPFSTFTPKHAFDLWTHYTLTGGPLPGLELGAGARSVSEFYALSGGANFVAAPYTVFSSQVGYTIAGRHKVALNIENLADRKYYEKVSGATRQNYYGTPRSFMLTVRSRF